MAVAGSGVPYVLLTWSAGQLVRGRAGMMHKDGLAKLDDVVASLLAGNQVRCQNRYDIVQKVRRMCQERAISE